MSQDKLNPPNPDLPHQSPVVPNLLKTDTKIQFRCYPGISCYNECCRHADITLTPYDILRMKKNLGLSTSEVLDKYTVPFEMDASGMPGIKLRTQNDKPVCLLMNDQGCSIYEDRPSACRYYPVGLLAMRATGAPNEEHHYCLVNEDHCKGHDEDNEITIDQYRDEQGVKEYDDMNREWYQIILKKRSSGPAVGKPSNMSLQLFFMCSYDIDRFRRFVDSDSFKATYLLEEVEAQQLQQDDTALMKFGFRLLKQVLYGENSIPMQEGVLEQRIEKRRDILEMRRQAEIEEHQRKNDIYDNMEK